MYTRPFTDDEQKVAQDLADYTFGLCKQKCSPRLGFCCSPEYCEMTIEEAEKLGIKLNKGTGDIPLLVDGSCQAPAWLRPLCTVHLCDWRQIRLTEAEEDTYMTYREAFSIVLSRVDPGDFA